MLDIWHKSKSDEQTFTSLTLLQACDMHCLLVTAHFHVQSFLAHLAHPMGMLKSRDIVPSCTQNSKERFKRLWL